jgi:hypothetical protein
VITFLHDKMKGLLLVLLAVIAVSFIFFGNWTPSGAVDPASGKMGRIGGHTLTFNELVAAQRQTLLEITLETGRIPSDNDRLIAIQTWIRLLQNQAAEQAGIAPQPDQLLSSIRQNPLFLKDGAYDPELFQRFSANFLSPQGFTGERFNQAIFDEVRTRQLLNALSSTAAVFPGEAEMRLARLFGSVDAKVIRWDSAKMTPPEPNPQDLESFHKNNQQAFAVPARATVEFVEFTAAGTDEESRKKAGEAAFAFTSQFFNLSEGQTRPDFSAKAAEAKLAVKNTPSFTAAETPFPGETDPRLTASALRLTPEEPVSDFLPSKNGFLVLHLKESQPGRLLSLAEAMEEVKSRWKEQARLQMADQASRGFLERANAELARGAKWEDLTKAAGLTSAKIPTFTPAGTNVLTFPDADRIRQVVTTLEANRVSPFLRTENGGLAVYVATRQPVPTEVASVQLPKIQAQLRNQRRSQLTRDWLVGQASQPGNELPQEIVQLLRGAF